MLRYAIVLALSVGAEPSASAKDTPVRLDDAVGVGAEQIRDVKAKATRAFPGEIERVYVGELVHPFANRGFRIHFRDEVVETYVIEREFVLEITSGDRGDRGSAKGARTAGFNRLEPALVPHGLLTSVKRLFPLKTAPLHLRLPDALSYRQAMSLLQAIESRTYRVRPEKPNVQEGLDRNDPIDVSKITELRYDEEAKTIEVLTKDRRHGGSLYTFAVQSDGFELLSVASWVS